MTGQAAHDGQARETPRTARMPEVLVGMVEQVRALSSGPMWAMPGDAVPQAVSHAHPLGTGSVTVGKAARIVRFEQDVEPVADPADLAAVVASDLRLVQGLGVLDQRVASCAGMVEYRLRLDPEGAALLDAETPRARPARRRRPWS